MPRRGQHAMVRGEGCYIWDDEGRQYLDLTASYGVTPLGHAHPALLKAINEQAGRLIALSSNFFNDRRAELLALLKARLPENFVHFFLCNSGTEANEAALKFAFLANRRPGWVALKRSFHGRTLGALATTWNPSFRETFAPLLQTATFVDPGDLRRARPRHRRPDRGVPRRGDPGRERGVADRARVPAARAEPLPRARRDVPRRRDPDRLRPHRRLVRARRARPRARPDDAGQGHGGRLPDRRRRDVGARVAVARSGHARHHLRRWTAPVRGGDRDDRDTRTPRIFPARRASREKRSWPDCGRRCALRRSCATCAVAG